MAPSARSPAPLVADASFEAIDHDVADLIDKGVLRTTLDQAFGTISAANLKRAHALLESGKSRGKIVLEGW
jgi:NADPH2:quinone reductase